MGLERYISGTVVPPNFISLMFKEILKALPSSNPFSVQLFIIVWNLNRVGHPIGQNEDISNLSDLLLSEIPLLYVNASTPAVTEFLVQYQCQCGHQERNMQNWPGKMFYRLPNINVGQSAAAVPVGQLLNTLLQTVIPFRCASCRGAVNGQYQVKKGRYTALRFDRFHHSNWRVVLPTRLSIARSNTVADQYLGRLVSVIAHVGDNQGGHYVTYTEVSGAWYQNSDDNPLYMVNFHPLNSRNPDETVNFLVFDNF